MNLRYTHKQVGVGAQTAVVVELRVTVVQVAVKGQGVSGPQEDDALTRLDPISKSEIFV